MQLHLPDRAFGGYIFDCDGTIADTMPLHFRAWTRALAELGGKFPEDLFYAWGGTTSVRIVEQLNEKFGLTLDPEATTALKESYYLELLPEVLPIVAVVELVKEFHGKAPVAVASGGHRELVLGSLGALDLVGYFDAIICAEDYEHGKPSPEPFLVAAKAIGCRPGIASFSRTARPASRPPRPRAWSMCSSRPRPPCRPKRTERIAP